jgi:ABC-2 type transport system ATP-binding protein
VEAQPGEYVIDGASSPERIATLTMWLATHGLALADLRAGRQTLEDVFLRLTSGGGADASPARVERRRHRVHAR